MEVESHDHDLNEAMLVSAALAGDRRAFGRLIDRHWPLLLAMCRRVLGSGWEAEDAAQEAALLAMLNLDRLRRPERFGQWLAGIGVNVSRRWLREGRADSWSWESIHGGRFTPGRGVPGPAPEEAAEVSELAERVRRAVNDLPAGQRQAAALFYLDGLTQDEVAAALEIRVGAVKGRLHKARWRLRERLRSVWREEEVQMEMEWIGMAASDVRRSPAQGETRERYVVLLEATEGDRGLPIWIGQHEGTAIAMLLERAEMPRPMTFRFLSSMLEAAGSRLAEVRISRLSGGTFYAEAVVEGSKGRAVVDARPSDAIALSLLSGAPIWVNQEVLREVEGEGTGSLGRYESERDRYVDGAGEIVSEARREWEIQLEQLRSQREA